MAQQENKIPLSKKNKREMSPFIGHELLYDFLTDSLDPERRAAVADHVKFSRDAQLDLSKIENGQKYAERLADTRVSEPIIEQINAPSSYLTVLMQKSNFDKWPQGLKWGLEALVVVGVIVTLLSVTPWQKVMQLGSLGGSKDMVLAEISKTETTAVVEEQPEFVDEGAKETPAEVTAKSPDKASVKPDVKASPATPTPTPTTVAAKTPEKAAEVPAVTGGGGFLYRGEIEATNIETIGPKVTDKIIELGGRKAGSVELGWKKTPTSMYYHFTIPEAKYQDLMNSLAAYGKPKFSKEKHPRVMPDGIIRLIFTLDETKK
ncbi:hypothetical protein EZJ49_04735 [Bdellovibrio bacteriovorus]|uniref:hypothetical protein n=1 Tax=Bdellovibrio bacteriovorus TaxID=959 RepID=UPI0021CFFB10|nr:hypothetical protein [Bdellovibrio bacteriovorus]UXR65557.1 hypothetical protein EZJ49_04735 [Bdellovibrio bacteriovorus]